MKIIETAVTTESSREFTLSRTHFASQEVTWQTALGTRLKERDLIQPGQHFQETVARLRSESRRLSGICRLNTAESRYRQQMALVMRILEALADTARTGSAWQIRAVRLHPASSRFWIPGHTTRPIGSELSYRISHETRTTIHETEKTRFSATGSVTTGDGRTLNLSLDLAMERDFFKVQTTEVESTGSFQLLDPLVINLDGNLPDLSEMTFSFDLDCDGTDENIPYFTSGSGYLCLDRNADQVVNDGSELFGAATGKGFGELAACDSDANGWIDENDPAFDKLGVWIPDPDTGGSITSLEDSGIGAISLASQETLFSLTDDDNNLKARIERTGLFLKEDGGAGTVQQLTFPADKSS